MKIHAEDIIPSTDLFGNKHKSKTNAKWIEWLFWPAEKRVGDEQGQIANSNANLSSPYLR